MYSVKCSERFSPKHHPSQFFINLLFITTVAERNSEFNRRSMDEQRDSVNSNISHPSSIPAPRHDSSLADSPSCPIQAPPQRPPPCPLVNPQSSIPMTQALPPPLVSSVAPRVAVSTDTGAKHSPRKPSPPPTPQTHSKSPNIPDNPDKPAPATVAKSNSTNKAPVRDGTLSAHNTPEYLTPDIIHIPSNNTLPSATASPQPQPQPQPQQPQPQISSRPHDIVHTEEHKSSEEHEPHLQQQSPDMHPSDQLGTTDFATDGRFKTMLSKLDDD